MERPKHSAQGSTSRPRLIPQQERQLAPPPVVRAAYQQPVDRVRMRPVAASVRRVARQQVVLAQDSLARLLLAVRPAAVAVVVRAAAAVIEQTHSTR